MEDRPGEKVLVSVDVTDFDSEFILAVCDYACNETYYRVSFSGLHNVDFDSFYGYRRYSIIPSGIYLHATDAYNGWYSFETADTMLMHTSMYKTGETQVAAASMWMDTFWVWIRRVPSLPCAPALGQADLG